MVVDEEEGAGFDLERVEERVATPELVGEEEGRPLEPELLQRLDLLDAVLLLKLRRLL